MSVPTALLNGPLPSPDEAFTQDKRSAMLGARPAPGLPNQNGHGEGGPATPYCPGYTHFCLSGTSTVSARKPIWNRVAVSVTFMVCSEQHKEKYQQE